MVATRTKIHANILKSKNENAPKIVWMTQRNMIVLDKTKITGISPVDYPQWEQENGLIYLY